MPATGGARFQPARPYNDLPRLPPAAEVETRAVLKACIEARAALAELKVAGELIPNPAILINTIPLLEARASSAIENIVTTADRLFRFAQDGERGHADPATKEALRYRTALRRGHDSLARRPVSTTTAIEMLTPGYLRGRVMSLYVLLFAGTTPIGAFLLGNAAERIGVQRAVVLFGAISALGVGLSVLYRASHMSRARGANAASAPPSP
jgi:hypothetical protein